MLHQTQIIEQAGDCEWIDTDTRLIESYQSGDKNSIQTSRVLLIDLENCPEQIFHLQENLERFSQVIICYAQTGAKIPLDWLLPLSETVRSDKLRICKMANIGKNAADFGICFFAGVLMQQLPAETHFVIVSNDSDLDHAVKLLQSQGRTAERIGTMKPLKETTTKMLEAIVEPKVLASLTKEYCAYLITTSKNRPAKKEKLLNSIKAKLNKHPELAAEILKLLMAKGIVIILGEKVSYDDKKIKELAK